MVRFEKYRWGSVTCFLAQVVTTFLSASPSPFCRMDAASAALCEGLDPSTNINGKGESAEFNLALKVPSRDQAELTATASMVMGQSASPQFG